MRIRAFVAAAAILGAAGCGGSHAAPNGDAIGKARCSANQAAGRITYITGFQFQADASILDVVAADAKGYFADLCLDVGIRPGTGDPASTARLVAAGTATIAGLGSDSDLITAAAHGVKVTGVATYGHVGAGTLLTAPGITDLKQLEGKTLGYKGVMPPDISAMLRRAGVDEKKIKEVAVGYDPTILPRGQVQALTAYKSNEPLTLRSKGFRFRQWNPEAYGVRGTFGLLVANPGFARRHPTAVEDFLRATLRGYRYCLRAASECVHDAAKRSQAGYDAGHNIAVWRTESAMIRRSQPAGTPLGDIAVRQFAPEIARLRRYHLIDGRPDMAAFVDPALVRAIYRGTRLVWPAP